MAVCSCSRYSQWYSTLTTCNRGWPTATTSVQYDVTRLHQPCRIDAGDRGSRVLMVRGSLNCTAALSICGAEFAALSVSRCQAEQLGKRRGLRWPIVAGGHCCKREYTCDWLRFAITHWSLEVRSTQVHLKGITNQLLRQVRFYRQFIHRKEIWLSDSFVSNFKWKENQTTSWRTLCRISHQIPLIGYFTQQHRQRWPFISPNFNSPNFISLN